MDERASILIVDDDKITLDICYEILSPCYEVIVARSGEEAFKRLEDIIPDLILLDVVMPGIDGYEVTTRLKSDNRYKKIPVIFISGQTDEESEILGFSVGAADYVYKPVSALPLLKRVETPIKMDRLQREADALNARIAVLEGR